MAHLIRIAGGEEYKTIKEVKKKVDRFIAVLDKYMIKYKLK